MAIKAASQMTLVDLTDAYGVTLSSEAYTFLGDTTGAPSGLSCSTEAQAICGSNVCTAVFVDAKSITCPTGISATVENSGTAKPKITFTTTAKITAACEATIPVVVDNITINKKFSFAVAKTGATGQPGASGKGIKSTATTYRAGASGTIAPTGEWKTSIPSVAASQYLWTKTVTTYTDNTTSTQYSVGMMGATGAKGDKGDTGATGKGIESTVVTYRSSTSGTTPPTGTWQSTIPSVAASQYLWTKTVTTYTDNTTSTQYSVGMMGATGAKGDKGDKGATGDAAISMTITSSNGNVFKNNTGSTVLTAHVFKGAVEQSIGTDGTVSGLGTVKWYKGTTLAGTGPTCNVTAGQVDNSQVYTCQLE